MHAIYDRLKRHFDFLGERAATEDDLFAFCADRGVEVVFAHEITRGVYVRHSRGTDHIFVNKNLLGWSLVYVLAHEIAHMLLHAPTRTGVRASCPRVFGFDGERCSRVNHEEAETAAALLMLPRVESVDTDLLDAESALEKRPYTELVVRRLDYLRRYGK